MVDGGSKTRQVSQLGNACIPILAVLQSVAGIVKRRHALPILANLVSRRTASIGLMDLDIGPLVLEALRYSAEVFALLSRPVATLKQAVALNLPPHFVFQQQG